MARNLRIRVVLEGADKLNRALRGISRAVHQASGERRRDAQATTRDVQRLEEQSSRAIRQHVRRNVRDYADGERQKRDETRRTAREAESSARRIARATQRGARSSGSGGGGGVGGALGRVGGVAAGLGSAGLSRVQGFQGALGVPSRDEMIQRWISSQQNFIRTSNQAGISGDQQNLIQARVARVSNATNVDPTQLMDSLTIAQNRFSDLQFVADNLEDFARVAQTTGSSVEDWVGAVGEFRRQLGVSADEVPDLIGTMVSAAREGSIEAGDIAANFTGLMSSFVALRGEEGRGMGGAREFMATAEALGGAGMGPEGTRMLLENLMTGLRRTGVQRHIEGTLGDREIFDQGGRLTIGMGDLLQRMSQDETFNTPAGLERIGLRDSQQQTAMNHLMNQFRSTGGNEVERLQNVSSEEGQRVIDSTMTQLMNSTSGRALNVGIRAQNNFSANGEGVIDLMTNLAGPLTDFSTRMPIASEALGFLADSARNTGITLAALKLFGGGGAATAAAAGGGAAAAGGGLGLGGILGGVFGGLALGAGAGLALGEIGVGDGRTLFGQQVMGENGVENRTLFDQWSNMGQTFDAAFGVDMFGGSGGGGSSSSAAAPAAANQRPTRLDDPSIDRLGQRIGQEVGRVLADGPNPEARRPGGSAGRR